MNQIQVSCLLQGNDLGLQITIPSTFRQISKYTAMTREEMKVVVHLLRRNVIDLLSRIRIDVILQKISNIVLQNMKLNLLLRTTKEMLRQEKSLSRLALPQETEVLQEISPNVSLQETLDTFHQETNLERNLPETVDIVPQEMNPNVVLPSPLGVQQVEVLLEKEERKMQAITSQEATQITPLRKLKDVLPTEIVKLNQGGLQEIRLLVVAMMTLIGLVYLH